LAYSPIDVFAYSFYVPPFLLLPWLAFAFVAFALTPLPFGHLPLSGEKFLASHPSPLTRGEHKGGSPREKTFPLLNLRPLSSFETRITQIRMDYIRAIRVSVFHYKPSSKNMPLNFHPATPPGGHKIRPCEFYSSHINHGVSHTAI
jgi:hypothetical protein